jgi:3-hydroxyisobutyrate dehydrogenase-like beta-hydroxyacid dehydrogenase
MRIAVFGLGEAGSSIASDLVATGTEIHAFDPADVPTPDGVIRHSDPTAAVSGAALVMSITTAADAREAMDQAWDAIDRPTIYADMATAAPALEEELANVAAGKDVLFADVALMAPVPGRGLGTPALAAGSGAAELGDLLNPLGANLETISGKAGQASARKLTRSVVTKGLATLIIECIEAADARDDGDWAREHIDALITTMDAEMVGRLLAGTRTHGARRLEEMETVARFLETLGVQPHMTRGTVERLRSYGQS